MPAAADHPWRGEPWQGTFDPQWLAPDMALLRAETSRWPSPGNVLVLLDDDGVALIDCGFGTARALAALEDALRTVGYPLSAVHTLLCTHPHTDHIGAVPAFADGRRVIVPVGAKAFLDDPALVAESILPATVRDLAPWLADLDIDGHFRVDCGAATASGTVEEIAPGETVRLGAHEWTAVHTPGHDAHLMCYWEASTGTLVHSDLLVTPGTAIPWYAPGGGGSHAYLDSLRRVADLEPALGVTGHGTTLHGAGAVASALTATRQAIVDRTDRIAATLADGPTTFAELERCVYPQVVHDVIPWASSVTAVHLLEAIEAGRARPVGGAYAATGGRR